jgi:hypothetical protein
MLLLDVARRHERNGVSLLTTVYELTSPKEAALFWERFAAPDAVKREIERVNKPARGGVSDEQMPIPDWRVPFSKNPPPDTDGKV